MTIIDFRGDSATIQFTVTDYYTGEIIDITGWKLVCEIWDGKSHQIKKATANVPGGGDLQIKITDAINGKFEIYIDKYETSDFLDSSYMEIAMLLGDQKDTIYKDDAIFKNVKITWESI